MDAIIRNFPGALVCITIALASTFIADHYGGPVMLFALLFGTGFHFLYEEGQSRAGIDFCAQDLLRMGVALLGFRITTGELMDIGLAPLVIVLAAVALTIIAGLVVARVFGLSKSLGLLAGSSVGICGASAALAVSSAMPNYRDKERECIFVVVTVTALSTAAMIFYPVFSSLLGLDDMQASIFLGGTIHDVAQVVGAGYSVNEFVGDNAMVIKLFRVAMLVPVVIIVSMMARKEKNHSDTKPALIPWFLLAFAAFVGVNSAGILPEAVTSSLTQLSRWFLVGAIAALGVKTSFKELTTVGAKPFLLMLFCTAVIAVSVLGLNTVLV